MAGGNNLCARVSFIICNALGEEPCRFRT
jgi:hypothetical protein